MIKAANDAIPGGLAGWLLVVIVVYLIIEIIRKM
jgi:hypothetical protein